MEIKLVSLVKSPATNFQLGAAAPPQPGVSTPEIRMSSEDSKCNCANCNDKVNHVDYSQDPSGVVVSTDATGTTYTIKPPSSTTGTNKTCMYKYFEPTYIGDPPYNPDCFVDSGLQMSFTDHQIMEIERRVARLEIQRADKPRAYEEMDDVDELIMDLEMLVRDNPDFYYVLESLVDAVYSNDDE